MDYNEIIAGNLKRIRTQNNLSLEGAAKLSGVSKSMIAQIEKGGVNPTISLIYKLAEGFRIPLSELIENPSEPVAIVRKKEAVLTEKDGGSFRDFMIMPYDSSRRFESHLLELDSSGYVKSDTLRKDSSAVLTVYRGRLAIHLGEQRHELSPGDTISFRAGLPYSLENRGKKPCRMGMVISY